MSCIKKKKEVIDEKEHIRRLLNKIFPQEMQSNHRMVGSEQQIKPKIYLWQPHNLRLYFDFNKENFNPKKPSNHTLRKYQSMVAIFNTAYTYTPLNYDKEHKYSNFLFCQIRVKKNQVEVINQSHNKQWRKMEVYSEKESDDKIDNVMDELKEEAIHALKCFIDLHGGKSDFRLLNSRCEHGIHKDDYLDKIPAELIIHDTYFKKPYKRKVEFLKTTAVKNYIANRSIERISPEITNELRQISHSLMPMLNKLNNSIKLEIKNKKLHQKVLEDMRKTMKDIRNTLHQSPLKWLQTHIHSISDTFLYKDEIQALSYDDRNRLSEWLFKRFKI